ncbi:plasmid replication protein RepC [Ancylobacter radicis]|uniref:plasmid replication protein RepC n=1 Tax=Ancylobacter radicis TaxID=2836179 RepID=UPI00350EC25F
MTPFGRQPMTLRLLASQMAARAVQRDAVVHKWRVFRDIREGRELIGATERSLSVLNALLSFHPETALGGDAAIIVWPSNEQLAARANGMPPTTLRRHIGVLVDCGLIIRRDSPNGKRFARRGRGGEIEQAYGFDLSPLVARAEEFRDLADAVHAEKKAFRVARERLTLLRRDIVKMIDVGVHEGIPGDWTRAERSYQEIITRLPRSAPRQLIEAISADLAQLSDEIRKALESFANSSIPGANARQSGGHIQNSKPDHPIEIEAAERAARTAGDGEPPECPDTPSPRELSLGIVLTACPAVRELAPGGQIRYWREFVATSQLVGRMLGICPSAWNDARKVLGEQHAAITLAAIYERGDKISNANGYLRSLTQRAQRGQFSIWPMTMALLRSNLHDRKAV